MLWTEDATPNPDQVDEERFGVVITTASSRYTKARRYSMSPRYRGAALRECAAAVRARARCGVARPAIRAQVQVSLTDGLADGSLNERLLFKPACDLRAGPAQNSPHLEIGIGIGAGPDLSVNARLERRSCCRKSAIALAVADSPIGQALLLGDGSVPLRFGGPLRPDGPVPIRLSRLPGPGGRVSLLLGLMLGGQSSRPPPRCWRLRLPASITKAVATEVTRARCRRANLRSW